ncbi:MAG: tetratricopeptide repeat protein [Candidatus Thorarchaeota archaeon]
MLTDSMAVSLYLDLITSSLDIATLHDPRTQDFIKEFDDMRFDNAEKLSLVRIASDENDYVGWALYGMLLMHRADLNGAMGALSKAMKLNDESLLVLNLWGDFLCCNGDDAEGEEVYWKALALKKEQVHPRKMLHFQFLSRNEYEEAIRVLMPVLRIRPHDTNTWLNLTKAFSKVESHAFAQEFAAQLTDQNPDQYRAWYIHGSVQLDLVRLEEAEEAARKAIKLRKKDALSWALLASVYSAQKKYNKAIYCCKKATKLQPKNFNAWLSLSMIYLKAGRVIEGKQAAKRAVAINPQGAQAVLDYLSKEDQ